MKNLFACSLLLLLFSNLRAQVRHHALSHGFQNAPQAVVPLAGDRWLVVGQGHEKPGIPFTDTTFIVVLDAAGDILLRRRLELPLEETHLIDDAAGTPDGGFAVATEVSYCDAFWPNLNLQKFDADGQLQWEKNWESFASWQPRLRATPDGHLLALCPESVWKLDATTGDVLWQTPAGAPPGNFWYDVALLPGTEDFVALGYNSIQIWKQTGNPGYTLAWSAPLSVAINADQVEAGPDAWFYALGSGSGRLIRFNETEGIQQLATFDWLPVAFAVADDGLLFLGRQDGENALVKTTFAGQTTAVLPMPDAWLSGLRLAARGGDLLLAGIDQSGPAAGSFADTRSQELWISLRSDAVPANALPDVGVTAVEQRTPVTVEDFYDGCNVLRHHVSGGDFRLQVTNFGVGPIQSVHLQTSFDWETGWVCFSLPVKRLRHEGLNLQPGASVWLEFGDIYAYNQLFVPDQFCFWTSGPDEQPDRVHDNDAYCHTATTATGEPGGSQAARLFPNPAGATGFWAEIPAAAAEPLDYRLCDAARRLAGSGRFATGETRVWVSAAGLPAGFYIFQAGKWRGKVIMEH